MATVGLQNAPFRFLYFYIVFGGVGVRTNQSPSPIDQRVTLSSNFSSELISDQKCCASHRFLLHHQMFGSRHHHHFKFCLPWSRENRESGRLFRKLVSPAGKLCAGILLGRGQFHQHSTSSFYVRRSQKCKKAA